MAYYLHDGARKTPLGLLLLQNLTNRLPNRLYHCGAALSGSGDDDGEAPSGDEHSQPPILPG